MKYLYLLLDLGSLFGPFVFSFHKGMYFRKEWGSFLKSASIVALVFLFWDALFAKYGIWGFNKRYYLGVDILYLPIEEWLFFFCIPFSSIFIHYVLIYFKPDWQLSLRSVYVLSVVLMLISAVLIIRFYDRLYTSVNLSLFVVSLALGLYVKPELLRRFYIAFLFILMPFFVVNGVLTGSLIEEPVVWYNNAENMGFRLITIPVEDTAYAFTMIFSSLLLMNTIFKK